MYGSYRGITNAFPVYLACFVLQWGYVVVTTPNGVFDHEEGIRQNVGGQVLGYFH